MRSVVPKQALSSGRHYRFSRFVSPLLFHDDRRSRQASNKPERLKDFHDPSFKNLSFEHLRRLKLGPMAINTYHNPGHIQDVLDAVDLILKNLRICIPEREKLLLRLAALFHDEKHPGYDTRRVPYRHLSDEEYAAIEADKVARPYFTVPERKILQDLILATTTFGPKAETYKASKVLEKIMVLADVFSFNEGFDTWLEKSAAVYQELKPDFRPQTVDDFKQKQLNFLDEIVIPRLSQVKDFMQKEFYESLSDKIDSLKDQLNDQEGQAKLEEALKELQPS